MADLWATNDTDRPPGLGERSGKIAEIIARQIVQTIAGEHVAPGSKLPAESDMLERFRVGRASLREALRILEVYGLIEIKPGPGGGPIVRGVKPSDFAQTSTFYFHLHGATLRDLLEARRSLEPLMARLAATSGDPEVIAELKRSNDLGREAFERGDKAGWRLHTSRFHSLLAGASGNRILDLFGESITDLYRERTQARMINPNLEEVVREHTAIVDAVVEGRADDAERLTAEHMTTFASITVEALSGVLDDVLDWR